MDVPADLFRLLVESVQDYAIYLLDTNGVIQSWNAGAQRLKGYSAAEIVGEHFSRFFSPPDAHAGKPLQVLARALSEGRVEDIGWRVRKDGSRFWASAIITTLRDPSGKHVGFAKVTRDLTDRAYRAFIEASHAIVWTLAPDGQPNADSPTWRQFTGQTEADWRDGRAWQPVHPDDAAHVAAAWTKAHAAGTPYDVELRLRRADGEYVWMRASTVPLLEPDGRVREWFGAATDISLQKQAQVEVERGLELWRTTLRSIGDAVISTDAQGRVQFLNSVSERLTGWSSVEAMGRPLTEVFPIFNEETHAIVDNPVDKVLRNGAIVGLANHTVLRNRAGVEIPIDDSAAPIFGPDGKIAGVVLVFRDVTDDKRESLRRSFLATATQQLVEAEDYAAALARIAQLAVPRLADWVAVEIAEAPGAPTRQVAVAHVDPSKIEFAREVSRAYPPDPNAPTGVPNVIRTGKSEFYSSIPKELLEAGAVDAEHLRLIRELHLRSAIVVPLRGRSQVFGAITFVFAESGRQYTEADLAFAAELADRAALIIERRRLEEEAEHANRMKDEFLATMSHELRTPLQAILGYAALLKNGHTQDTKKALDVIERNAVAQAHLVEDILDVSRIASGKLRLTMARVDIATAVRAALDAVRPAAQARRIMLVETSGRSSARFKVTSSGCNRSSGTSCRTR
ncbi:MAG TPA: PAS domain S-box protein [Gemmatimonadaceae bacterium]|jgi:PAS domain S-box-containing protein|nr:PAS domain S-box protein [Gemmatimonadaceae bacterium]